MPGSVLVPTGTGTRVVDSRSTVGSIVGERSDDDSGNLELVRGGPTGPNMTLKASGGDTGNHASPQRA
eukprot:SAG11_NODE_36418_length_261_cov_1.500000_1_plen_67_part_10